MLTAFRPSAVADFHLIPVIDLLHGQVVHAREGRRSEYAPIQSNLCSGADPETIMAALLHLHPFRTFYFAALALDGIELWVDTGIADETALNRWVAAGTGKAVIGSESLADARFMAGARACSPVLSLDFFGETFKGPAALLRDAVHYWPESVLAMNLKRVGSDAGPDLALIGMLAAKASDRRIYAAGGVRSIEDLHQVRTAGAAGALLATSLHDGRIGPAELRRFETAMQSEK